MHSPAGYDHTPKGAAATELILAVFRLNGDLLRAGDELIADLNLTSARWQVLGAIGLSEEPQPVANLARDMGLTRQAVQRVANELESEGFVAYTSNPHHRRAKLVVLTERGTHAVRAAARRQGPWINELVAELSLRDIRCALNLARALDEKLNAASPVKRRGPS
jgi:DNA-binding MarR family transcriptional regulator